MKTRRLSRGRTEAYNRKIRIRLEPLPGRETSRVTVYQLKPNRFYSARREFEMQQPVSIHEVVELYGGFESILSINPEY